jgi:outer membrane protein assembly factor BamA
MLRRRAPTNEDTVKRITTLILTLITCSSCDRSTGSTEPSPAVVAQAPSAATGKGLVARAVLQGNKALSEAALRTAIGEAESLEDAAATIDELYLANGYVVAKTTPQVDAAQGTTKLTIVEGERFNVGTVEVVETSKSKTKDRLGEPKELQALVSLKAGEPFDRAKLRAAMAAILDRFDAAGYGAANVTPLTTLDLEKHTVSLRLEVDRDLRRLIDKVEITGAPAGSEATLRELVGFKVGGIFSDKARHQAEIRLAASDRFKNATILVESVPGKGENGAVRVTVNAQP